MQQCLVTGGAGFIGSHLVENLLAKGRRVVVIDDLSTGRMENLAKVKNHANLQVEIGDIRSKDLIIKHLDQVDVVYHLAAVLGVRRILDEPALTVSVNSEATSMILEQTAKRGLRLFLASTSEVYGKNSKAKLSEEDDCVIGPSQRTRWIYACGKAQDDYLALSYHRRQGLPVVIGRFFNTVGPRQIGVYGMVVPRFVEQALAGGPIQVYGDGQQVRCFGHVNDVVRGIQSLMACPSAVGKVFNLGNDEPISIRGLAERVAEHVDPAIPIEQVPYEQVYGSDFEEIRSRVPDLSRVRTTIDYRARFDLDRIIRDVVQWKRKNGHGSTWTPRKTLVPHAVDLDSMLAVAFPS